MDLANVVCISMILPSSLSKKFIEIIIFNLHRKKEQIISILWRKFNIKSSITTFMENEFGEFLAVYIHNSLHTTETNKVYFS